MLGSPSTLTRRMRGVLAATALVLLGASAFATSHGVEGDRQTAGATTPTAITSSIHLALGVPRASDPSDDELMVKPEYALGYSHARSAASWVSWELNASWLGDVRRHRGHFLPDDALPVGWYRVRHEDYSGSGFDRGHLVPSQDRTRTREANLATFLLTNVLPQAHELNAGAWLDLEAYCRRLATREGRELFVMAGGIFAAHPRTLGGGVSVPDAFFKIVVVLDPGQGARDVEMSTRVIAVILPNTARLPERGWAGYRTTVRAIERRTGYDFLPNVPVPIQRVIENRVDDGPTH
jgi:endonuclease G